MARTLAVAERGPRAMFHMHQHAPRHLHACIIQVLCFLGTARVLPPLLSVRYKMRSDFRTLPFITAFPFSCAERSRSTRVPSHLGHSARRNKILYLGTAPALPDPLSPNSLKYSLMDSLPQELIDEIIEKLPLYSLRSASRVAKRWRRRSQQRLLSTVEFRSQVMVYHWYEETQNDPGGISSYVQSAVFDGVFKWRKPALFSPVLRNFNSLTSLSISLVEIPDKVMESISQCGGLSHSITTLHLRMLPFCSLSGVILPMIIAIPNLQNLLLDAVSASPEELPQGYPVLQRRRPLESLRADICMNEVTSAIADLQFEPRSLVIDIRTWTIQKLLVPLSTMLVELVLIGECSLCVDHEIINDSFPDHVDPRSESWRVAHLPPFPALTSLGIHVPNTLTLHLVDALHAISSAPALASITLEYARKFGSKQDRRSGWDSLDRWLAQMADKNASSAGCLVLTVVQTHGPIPTELFPKFKKVGKVRGREISEWPKKQWDMCLGF